MYFDRMRPPGSTSWCRLHHSATPSDFRSWCLDTAVERYTAQRLDAACRRALAVDLIDVRRLERILVQALEQEAMPQLPLPMPPGRFARSGGVCLHRIPPPQRLPILEPPNSLLKSLKLGALASTLPERIPWPVGSSWTTPFLEISSATRSIGAHRRTELRLHNAGFEETCRLEDFDWSASITLDRRLLDAVFSLEFLDRHEHVLLVGPAGVGKSFFAQALGYAAVRAGYSVRFSHADDFFKALTQARVDNSVDRAFRSFLTPDLLILDDLGLHGLTAQQSADLYELILNRHRASSFIITSNRAVDEWLGLFDDPILGNSALDRLANASYQIVIEGASYRERLSPHRALLAAKGVIDPQTTT